MYVLQRIRRRKYWRVLCYQETDIEPETFNEIFSSIERIGIPALAFRGGIVERYICIATYGSPRDFEKISLPAPIETRFGLVSVYDMIHRFKLVAATKHFLNNGGQRLCLRDVLEKLRTMRDKRALI